MNLEMPNYRTIQPQGAVPVFVSSLAFNGVTYTGDVGKSKKEAEQLAARAAIQSLYGMPFFVLYFGVMHVSIHSTNKGCTDRI